MSISTVKQYLTQYNQASNVLEFPVSSATVELAAQALGVEPALIAKTMSFRSKDESGCLLIVTAGDVKIDNAKFKQYFGFKAKMLTAEEVSSMTGHEIGGVCPFANPGCVTTYLDISLKRFSTVYPAAGSSNSAVPLSCDQLFVCSRAQAWIDVCKPKSL